MVVAVPEQVLKQLSSLDRFLTIWIFLAMVIGIGAGAVFPELPTIIDMFRVQEISLPIAIGLIWMMYPPLARVKYEELPRVVRNRRIFGVSLIQNWVVGPILMTVLAWIFLSDLPEYMFGLIIIGMARCIAMVLVWNHLAQGDHEYCASLVALNSIFQIFAYAAYIYFFGIVLTSQVGLATGIRTLDISMWQVAATVLVFLGIPFFAGMITRFSLIRRMGKRWYEEVFLHKIDPTTLIGLLFTIVILFSLRAESVLILPWHVLRVAVPLLLYFSLMFMVSFFMSKALGFTYAQTASLSFTAASNNFELAIATTVGLFGLSSGQAFATVVGPLIEVPIMISLVNFALWAKRRLFPEERIPIPADESKLRSPSKGA